MADGSVEFEIRADNSGVEATINDTTSKLKSAAGQWEGATQGAANSSSMFSGVLQGVGQMLGGVVASMAQKAVAGLKEFAMSCIDAASDLDEVRNVVDTVFGSDAGEIYEWAKSAQSAFGLAQTAALRYTSTLGALLKSSGLGMTEVKEMSTTIAGLAADMASFYNLDFDTAFEKLKSGISGETEPLKALGINLSAANLEAFALAQGLDKAYSSMGQAEQMALRYQYILQATTDAQGDFARTADGYANSLRRMESAWETIKTVIGGGLMTVVEPLVSKFADFLSMLTTPPEKTIFDEINTADTNYEAEIANIQKTADEARILIETLDKIHSNTAVSDQKSQFVTLIDALIEKIPGLQSVLAGEDPSVKIKALAQALSNDGNGIDASKWEQALKDFGTYAGDLAQAMKSEDPAGEIKKLAEALAPGSGISVDEWNDILTKFSQTLAESNVTNEVTNIEQQIDKLSKALSQETGISTSAWDTALTYFGTYKDKLFAALSSTDADAKLKELAQNLAVEYPTVSVETWGKILTELQKQLEAGDKQLSVAGIIEKLTKLTDAVGSAGEIKLGDMLNSIDTDAGGVTHANVDAWAAVLGTFSGNIGGFNRAMGQYDGGATTKIKNLAAALSGIDGDEAKVNAWKELVGLLVNNAEEIGEIMGWSGDETWGWVTSLLDSVNNLDPTKADSFEKLWGLILGDGSNGKGLGDLTVPENVVGSFNAATEAMEGTYYASAQEIEILKRLMQLYPQLSEIVNINTGEIKGGIDALKDYVDEAEATRIKLAMQKRLDDIQKIIDERYNYVAEWQVDLVINDTKLDKALNRLHDLKKVLDEYGVITGIDSTGEWGILNGSDVVHLLDTPIEGIEGASTLMDVVNLYHEASEAVTQYSDAHDELAGKIATEKAEIGEVKAQLEEEAEAFGMSTDAKDANADATDRVVMAEEDAAKALASLKQQLQDIVNYQDNVRNSVLGTLSQTVEGLKAVDRESEEYRKSFSGNQLAANLESQIKFLEEYSGLMEQARQRGFTDEVLSTVADGSVESLQYLRGLATATSDEVTAINEKFAKVTAKKNDLADKITAQKLAVDEAYQAMIQKAEEAAKAMDQSAVAGAGASATIEAVVSAVAAGRETLASEVEAINALLASIGQIGNYGVYGASGGIIGTGGTVVGRARGTYAAPHAMGLDYVPYDGYLAELHQGETILTADEAAIWRNFSGADSANTQQAFDYDMIGAAITSGMPSGGNVYLDGQTVGRIISQGQGESYRRLQRSGWRG